MGRGLFTIQDNTGMYTDKNAIRHIKDENGKWKWEYRCKPDFYNYINCFLSVEDAQEAIKEIEKNLHRMGKDFIKTFKVKDVEALKRCNQLFTIQDNEGQYADKYSIWYNSESGKWNYTTYPNTNAPLILCRSKEDVEKDITDLTANLHKVNKEGMTFTVQEINS